MPRKLKRYTGRGDLHFITFSCYERRPFLQSKRAKNLFVKILGEVRARFGFRLLGYVLMPDHVHLLIDESPAAAPATIIQVLKQRISRLLRGKRPGAPGQLPLPFPNPFAEHRRFWQRRYYDFNVYSREKLREKLHYMHANPVNRGLVLHPRDWPWSSWSFYAHGQGLLAIDTWEGPALSGPQDRRRKARETEERAHPFSKARKGRAPSRFAVSLQMSVIPVFLTRHPLREEIIQCATRLGSMTCVNRPKAS